MERPLSVLLLKLPYCTHPDSLSTDDDFRTKAPFRPVPSLALAALCAFVERHKTLELDLRAIDLNIEAYTSPEAAIDTRSYVRLLTDAIRDGRYDVLGLSAPFVYNVRWVDMAVRLSRRHHPGSKIILGGGYPTIFPERALREHALDFAVVGEGETAFLHILNLCASHHDARFEERFPFEGYAARTADGQVRVVPRRKSFLSGDDLPAPAWRHLDVDKYFERSGETLLPIEGGRGCPYNCTYCCTYLSWGRRLRLKPASKLVEEIALTRAGFPRAVLGFIDDNMTFDKEWLKDFLRELCSRGFQQDIVASNFSVKDLDEERIDLLASAGFKSFGIAVESGSMEIQKRTRKNLDFEKVREAVRIAKSRNVHVHICWMLGFPGETLEQIEQTIAFARELRAHSNQFLTVLPYPGTKLFEDAEKAGLLLFSDEYLDRFDNRKCECVRSAEWDYERLRMLIYDANIEINFLNNPYLDSKAGRAAFQKRQEDFLKQLPDHVIAHVIIGYIRGLEGDRAGSDGHYGKAAELLESAGPNKTFGRYLSWDHKIIKDYLSRVSKKASAA